MQSRAESEDDAWLQDMELFRKSPLNLNTADADELKQLRILTDLQIESLVSYRNLLGNFIDIHELQAIPCWDTRMIQKLLPFISISSSAPLLKEGGKRLRDGDQQILFRISGLLQKSEAFKSSGSTRYAGVLRVFFSGIVIIINTCCNSVYCVIKMQGNSFSKADRSMGFDFYSFHFFARKMGIVQALAIGDFTVNMGQGLIQWQSLAFKKSSDITAIKRQSAVLRPYSSAGEFYFFRGAGTTIRLKKTK